MIIRQPGAIRKMCKMTSVRRSALQRQLRKEKRPATKKMSLVSLGISKAKSHKYATSRDKHTYHKRSASSDRSSALSFRSQDPSLCEGIFPEVHKNVRNNLILFHHFLSYQRIASIS